MEMTRCGATAALQRWPCCAPPVNAIQFEKLYYIYLRALPFGLFCVTSQAPNRSKQHEHSGAP